MKYRLIIGSEFKDVVQSHLDFKSRDEAIKELLYKVEEYNRVVKDINETTGYEYHSLLKKVEPKEGEEVRYENEIDYFYIKSQ
jgi:flagellar capping protein FliD